MDTRNTEMDERDKRKAKVSPEEAKRYNDQIPKINNESAQIGEKAADAAIKIQYPGYARIHPTSLDSFTSIVLHRQRVTLIWFIKMLMLTTLYLKKVVGSKKSVCLRVKPF